MTMTFLIQSLTLRRRDSAEAVGSSGANHIRLSLPFCIKSARRHPLRYVTSVLLPLLVELRIKRDERLSCSPPGFRNSIVKGGKYPLSTKSKQATESSRPFIYLLDSEPRETISILCRKDFIKSLICCTEHPTEVFSEYCDAFH